MIIVPFSLVALVLLFLTAGLYAALQVNIMPFVSTLFAICGIISFVCAFRCEEEKRPTAIICGAVCAVAFLITVGSSVSTGDILSWIWYHI